MSLRASIEQQWYSRPTWLWLLLPLHIKFIIISALRRFYLCLTAQKVNCPVIIVGNIVVGGTGKTPVIAALTRRLQANGFKPGIISRGYGGSLKGVAAVNATSSPQVFGDEPVMLAQMTGVPVYIGTDRVAAAKKILAETDCTVLLCDDGLQHYRLARDIEIVVVDAARQFGNGWCMPIGPLRESVGRIQKCDYILLNQTIKKEILMFSKACSAHGFELQPSLWVNVQTGEKKTLTELRSQLALDGRRKPAAVCAIGNPERFYATLNSVGVDFEPHTFDDHHQFKPHDFANFIGLPVLMTEKDAVKCSSFARPDWWALQVEAKLPTEFLDSFEERVNHLLK